MPREVEKKQKDPTERFPFSDRARDVDNSAKAFARNLGHTTDERHLFFLAFLLDGTFQFQLREFDLSTESLRTLLFPDVFPPKKDINKVEEKPGIAVPGILRRREIILNRAIGRAQIEKLTQQSPMVFPTHIATAVLSDVRGYVPALLINTHGENYYFGIRDAMGLPKAINTNKEKLVSD